MSGTGNHGEYCTAGDVRNVLTALMPELSGYWHRPLRDYASNVYDMAEFRSDCPVRHQAMDLLCRCVERAARRSGHDMENARNAILQLKALPVLQTGPHCLLLLEPDAFYTHLSSLLGLEAHGSRWYFSYHASRVSFSERAKKGPGWLLFEDEPLNVFGLPRSRMGSASICGLDGPYRFAFTNPKGVAAPNASAARLLALLPSDEFPTAADAIRAANQVLWRSRIPSPVKLVQLDDTDVADLMADHLDDPQSWMSLHFVGGKCAAHILEAMDRLDTGPWKGWIRRTTDFFWHLEGGKIAPLRLQGGLLRAGSDFKVEFQPQAIAAELRKRAILPSLYTVFLVTSILPGVRVLGGCRQSIYYPLMGYVTTVAIEQSGNGALLTELCGDVRPGLWGHRVLKPSKGYPCSEIELLREATTPMSEYAEMSLSQASGDLSSFTSDPIWAELADHIRTRAITPLSPEWGWSAS